VLVPALSTWHEHHESARRALGQQVVAVGHCVVEAYSVLTRLPEPLRVAESLAARALEALVDRVLAVDDDELRLVPSRLAAAGVAGGAAYDGLIALTAATHGATLVTRDARAATTYRACGARFELLEP
jgi:predicted nucleic acid-binding protein